jgi:hypothetical protein
MSSFRVLTAKLVRLGDLVEVIDDALSYIEDERANNCCGGACNCYDNHKFDMAQAYDELATLGYAYIDGLLVATDDVEIPASVDNAQEGYYPDAF